MSVYAHDKHHKSNWIGDNNIRNPKNNKLCCGKEDCKSIDFSDVRQTRGGYFVGSDQKFVSADEVVFILTPDGKPWVCKYGEDDHDYNEGAKGTSLEGEVRCLLLPLGV